MAANHAMEDELRPDAEASRIIEDRDLMDIDIKELNKMLKERNVSKELAVNWQQQEIFRQYYMSFIRFDLNRGEELWRTETMPAAVGRRRMKKFQGWKDSKDRRWLCTCGAITVECAEKVAYLLTFKYGGK